MSRLKFIKTGCAIIVLLVVSCRNDSGETSSSVLATDTLVSDKMQEAHKIKTESMSYVVSKDGTKIAFEKKGTGPALIIVSGALSARTLFTGEPMLLVDMLSKHFTVYIYDRRGRGESTDQQPYAVQREVEDLESLIDHAGGHAYLYGVSSGGALSLHAAGNLGATKVQKLAIFEPPYGQGKKVFEKQKQGVNEHINNGKPGDAAQFFLSEIGTPTAVIEKMKSSPAWKTIEKLDFTLRYDYQVLGDGEIPRDLVKTIMIPTLVLAGDKSMDFILATTEQLAMIIPDTEQKTLQGQTHQPKAEAIGPVIIAFFNK